jgi:hypothetical protein
MQWVKYTDFLTSDLTCTLWRADGSRSPRRCAQMDCSVAPLRGLLDAVPHTTCPHGQCVCMLLHSWLHTPS